MNELETVVERLKQESPTPPPSGARSDMSTAQRARPSWLQIAPAAGRADAPKDIPAKAAATDQPQSQQGAPAEATPLSAALRAAAAARTGAKVGADTAGDAPAPKAETPAATAKPEPRLRAVRAEPAASSSQEPIIAERAASGSAPKQPKRTAPPPTPPNRPGLPVRGLWWSLSAGMVALLLLGGLVWWSVALTERDMMEIPTVRAMTAPVKVPMERPSGIVAQNQGLSVNEVLDGGGVLEVAAQVTVVSDAEPLVEGEDLSGSQMPAPAAELTSTAEAETEMAAVEPAAVPAVDAPVAEVVQAVPSATELAPAEVIPPANVVEIPQTDMALATPDLNAGSDVAQVTQPAATDLAVVDPSAPNPPAGVGAAYAPVMVARAPVRPQAIVMVAQTRTTADAPANSAASMDMALAINDALEQATAPVAAAGPLEVETMPAQAGRHLVQLGAFESAEIARREWTRMTERHGGLLLGKPAFIQRTQSSGRTFFRVRVGALGSRANAADLCKALDAQGQICMAVNLN